MPCHIEDYAFLSDLESAALVGTDGSIDWLTFPRFDSAACFAALLGERRNGRWLLAPEGGIRSVTRRYRDSTLVLETVYTTDDGEVLVTDCMPPRDDHLEVIRIVEGRRGRVPMEMELVIRFDYGSIVPWVRRDDDGATLAVGGPDALQLTCPVPVRGHDLTTVANFSVGKGDVVPFRLTWSPSHNPARPTNDPLDAVASAEQWWAQWAAQCNYAGAWSDEVKASLVVLKGLIYAPTGGVAAAATTSLPEWIGSERNWDYRYCWLRDATYTLLALINAGFRDEAVAWRDWLLRAVAGDPAKLQIMYGLAGERRLPEQELTWLSGYENSRPVRIGNAASTQFQLDVYGEVMDAAYHANLADIGTDGVVWRLQEMLVEFLETAWQKPDDGIWEVRGGRKQFTHSKVMAWVGVDRAIRTAEGTNDTRHLDRWRQLRDDIKKWVLAECVDDRGRIVQYPGTSELDASLLMVPLVGFLPPDDPRVIATVNGVASELTTNGFVSRYTTRAELDGLPAGEGTFLMCSFWLAQAQALIGQLDAAEEMFSRLCALRNDVGLLSEQYDPVAGRMLGNIPQAFSHTALVNTAGALSAARGAARAGSTQAAANPRQPH